MRRLGWSPIAALLFVAVASVPVCADTTTSLGDRGGEGSTPFTGLAQSEANLFTGALGTEIPIRLPAARRLTPQLTLRYSSAGGASPIGFGWDLSLGRIERSTKWGVPTCNGPHSDDFVLVLPSGTVELVADPPGSDTYRPKVEETFLEARKNVLTNSWVVYQSGMKYVFGDHILARSGNDVSRFMYEDPSGACLFTTAWGLTHAETASGDTMDVSYYWDENVFYPAFINYGGNVLANQNHVYSIEFRYAPREEVETHRSGARAVLRERLQEIVVTTSIPSSTPISTYRFSYAEHPYRTLLSSVELVGMPESVFSYASAPDGFAAPIDYTPPPNPFDLNMPHRYLRIADRSAEVRQTLLDMDGDGYLDMVRIPHSSEGANAWVFYRGTPDGFSSEKRRWQLPNPSLMADIRNVRNDSDGNVRTQYDTLDLSGDGIPDFIVAHPDQRAIWGGTVDCNGDGDDDLTWASGGDDDMVWTVYPGRAVRLADGTIEWGFGDPQIWCAPRPYVRADYTEPQPSDPDLRTQSNSWTYQDLIDANGDGLPDLVYGGHPTLEGPVTSLLVYLNNGAGFDLVPSSWELPEPMIGLRHDFLQVPDNEGRRSGSTERDLIDFNGDGLPDVVQSGGMSLECSRDTDGDGQIDQGASCLFVYFNTGQAFAPLTLVTAPTTTIRSWTAAGQTYFELVDLNGDGLPDTVDAGYEYWNGTWSQGWQVALNQGGRFEPLTPESGWFCGPTVCVEERLVAPRTWSGVSGPIRLVQDSNTMVDLIDFDGDGMLEYVNASYSGYWRIYSSHNSIKPDLLTSIQNGLGGYTDVFYAPSTRFENDGGDGIPDLPFVSWVTTAIRRTDGSCDPGSNVPDLLDPQQNPCIDQGHELNARFVYRDGRFDAAEREFRGFRHVYRIDMDANATLTTFGQDDLTNGKVLQVDTYAGNPGSDPSEPGAQAHLVRSAYNWWAAGSFPGTQSGRTQLWLGAVDRVIFDLATTTPHLHESVNDRPDAYGNLLHTYTWGLFGAGRVDTYMDYATASGAPSAGGAVHDKPAHVKVVAGGATVSEQWLFYDGNNDASVSKGNVTRVESWLDSVTGPGSLPCTVDSGKPCVAVQNTYDTYGNITEVRDALGATSSTIYDQWGLYPTQETNALGHTTQTVTDYRWGKPTAVTDPNGAVVQYRYDGLGRLELVARPDDTLSWEGASERFSYFYGTGGSLSRVTVERKEPNNPQTGYVPSAEYFDALGRHRYAETFRVVGGQGQTVIAGKVEYDQGGRVAKRYDPYPASSAVPNNGFTTYDYRLNGSAYTDPLGRTHRVTAVDGTVSTVLYDRFSTTAIDEEGYKTVTWVDTYGRTVKKEVYSGTGPYTLYSHIAYTYDGAGRLRTTEQNGDNRTTITNTYDSLGRKLSTIDPDSGTWQYRYDAVGNLIFQDDPKPSQHLQFVYDKLRRVKQKWYFGNDAYCADLSGSDPCVQYATGSTSYTYDFAANAKGRLTQADDPSGTTTFEYDQRGRTKATTKTIWVDGRSKTATTRFEYDAADHLRLTTYPDGEVVTTEYDASGQPKSLRSSDGTYFVNGAEFDLFGRLARLEHANNVQDIREYHGQPVSTPSGQDPPGPGSFPLGHRLRRIASVGPAGAVYLSLGYDGYTARGLLETVNDVRNPTGELSNKAGYTYDFMGRLVQVSDSPTQNATYEHDALGNLRRKEGAELRYDDPLRPHQLTAVCTTPEICSPVGHDPNGNRSMKDGGGAAYEYDADDRAKMIVAGGNTIELQYDYSGQRVVEIVNPDAGQWVTRYFNDLFEASSDGYATKHYFFAGVRVASQRRDIAYQFSALDGGPIALASVSLGRPVLVLLLRRDAQLVAAVSTTVLAAGLLWRRGGASRSSDCGYGTGTSSEWRSPSRSRASRGRSSSSRPWRAVAEEEAAAEARATPRPPPALRLARRR